MAKIKCTKCGTEKKTRPDRLAAMGEEVIKSYLCRGCRPEKVKKAKPEASA